MSGPCLEVEKKVLAQSLKDIVDALDNTRECKPCCASESGQQKQNHGPPSKAKEKERKGGCHPPAKRETGAPFERGDAHPCRQCQPPPPPVSGPSLVVPLQTTHRIGRPVPLIVEPDYVRRETPEKFIIALPPPIKVRSRELIASHMYHGCLCGKRNGLQDQCRRWDCRGFPFCCSNGLCKPSGGAGCDGTQCRKA